MTQLPFRNELYSAQARRIQLEKELAVARKALANELHANEALRRDAPVYAPGAEVLSHALIVVLLAFLMAVGVLLFVIP